ncbi:MAG TPA: hypothetical protein VFJ17_00920 [Mycobacteriales bacterium]|jgi:MFS family permease|nr:hypothetical protein [Mycobacteriales bacterium]
MTMRQLERPTNHYQPTDPSLGRAWFAIVMIPVFFAISFALSYVLYDLFGYKPENNDAPLWVNVIVALVGLAIFVAPCVAAAFFGRRAVRSGDRRGLVPMVLGVMAGCALTVVTVVTTVADAAR